MRGSESINIEESILNPETMKKKLFSALMLLLFCGNIAFADNFVNLTPLPKQMTAGNGEYVLPASFKIATANLSDEMRAEVDKFVEAFNSATGCTASIEDAASDAIVRVSCNDALTAEGYTFNVDDTGIMLEAATPAGLFYAFQTFKKILPGNVMAGVKDATVTKYALPYVSITDEPRYEQRGFMLDVSRHFFTVEEVKRVLDLMACYKMNSFHWHLTDDQGWRVEIKKWPKLTEVGSIAPNCRRTDMFYGQYYWTNEPYGPYFYTQDELREVVAYAKERHIEIIPEIDMPGHFVAALVAYPEFSCSPEAGRSVWVNGGISSDVLNVANPAAVQFAKDILAEIMDIFPGEYIHIGGDECPTSAWEHNAECQELYAELGLTSYRQLQSNFIKQVGDFIKSEGRKVAAWNEAITESGSDTKLMQDVDALIYCWTGADNAANVAKGLGLKSIYTPQVPYYINRKQRPDDLNAGDGSDNLQRVYNLSPYNDAYGIQGTFWTEHVSEPEHLEYQALPRLMAIAEAAWTPQAKRNFTDFCTRITADSTMLNYNNYYYNRDYMNAGSTSSPGGKVMPVASTATQPFYYRIVTRATGDRTNLCWELLREGSPLITTYGGKQAAAGKLWGAAQAAEGDAAYDYQHWAFELDPNGSGKYALVCKAQPNGSLNPTPSATSTNGRWTYDNSAKHYEFILGESNFYGEVDGVYYYSIRSSKVNGQYLNSSLSGQGFAINCYGNPADGNGGLFLLHPMSEIVETATANELIAKANYLLDRIETYEGTERVLGAFSKTEADSLRTLADKENIESLTQDEMSLYIDSLNKAYNDVYASFGFLEVGRTYRFANNVKGYEGIAITDKGESGRLTHSTDIWDNDAWEVTESSLSNNVQSVKLKNVGTGRFIAASASSSTGNVGFPVAIGASAADVRFTFDLNEKDYTLSSNGKNFYPVPQKSSTLPGIISSGSNAGDQASNAFRPMGSAWSVTPVTVYTYNCKDTEGTDLGTFVRSVVATEDNPASICPTIANHKVKTSAIEGTVVSITYERESYSISIEACDRHGALLYRETVSSPVNQEFTVSLPEIEYYTLESSEEADGAVITPTADRRISAVYSTTAYAGVKTVADVVEQPLAGHSYLIYDNSDANNGGRRGYRTILASTKKVNRVVNAEGAGPLTPWTFEESGNGFKIKNEYLKLYVPTFGKNENPTVGTNGGVFTFTQNVDNSWKIQGSNGQCWDGQENGNMVGWDTPGHPHIIYEYFVQPYFEVTVKCVDGENKAVAAESKTLVVAGSAFTLSAPIVEGYLVKNIDNEAALGAVADNTVVTVIYEPEPASDIDSAEADSQQSSDIYDLSGRKVQKISTRGVYIVGGKKVLMK